MAVDQHIAPHWDTAALITIDMQRDFLSDAPFGLAGTTEILPNLGKLAEAFRSTGRPIVHIVRLYPADGQDVDRVRRTVVEGGAVFVRPGTPGRLLAPGLGPTSGPTSCRDDGPTADRIGGPTAGSTDGPTAGPTGGPTAGRDDDLDDGLDDNLDDEALLRGEPQRLGPAEYVLYKPRWGAFYRTKLDELLAGHGVDTLVFGGCNLPNCPRASIIEAHERDYRVVLVTDAVSQASDQGFREIAGLGTVLCTTADAVSRTA